MLNEVLKRLFQGHNKFSILLLLAGTITWSLTMVKSGIVYGFGMGFWGPNGHDGIWHIAVAESLSRGTLDMPIFAGEAIRNYHIGFDLLLAILHRITFIPIHNLYFQILPPLLAFGIGLAVYRFVYLWKDSKSAALWATFFVYFGGSFGWLVNLFRTQTFGGESMFWAQQSVSSLINPPFALSLLLIFVGLIFLLRGIREKKKDFLTIAAFLFGFLIFIKVYAGVLVLGGLFVAGAWNVFKSRDLRVVRVFGGTLVLSLLLFLPLNSESGNSLVFQPFWFLETIMLIPDRFGWEKLGSAMLNYRAGGVWHKAIAAYTLGFFIFWYGNLGTRLLGQFYIAKKLIQRKLDYIEVFIFIIILAGTILPMLFVQKGTAWNTIQFFYYSLVFMSVLSGIYVSKVLEKVKMSTYRYVAVVVVIIFTVPTTVNTLSMHYLPSRPPSKISNQELEALKFLKNQPEGIVLTMPFDVRAAINALDNPPRPLHLYVSTAYVSAFSGKPVYLEDEVNLEITGYDWRERRNGVEKVLEGNSNSSLGEFLRENNITYLYLTEPNVIKNHLDDAGMETIFWNEKASIYRIL